MIRDRERQRGRWWGSVGRGLCFSRLQVKVIMDAVHTFTFTMLAVPFIARLADAFVRPQGVLADGVDAAVVQSLGTLVHIYGE